VKTILSNICKRAKFLAVFAIAMLIMAVGASAQTDASAVVSAVETAFELIAPVTVAIVTFFVVIRLAKRVVK
jgi:riboflavin transporter FmnP